MAALLCFLFLLLTASTASAQTHRLKFVFPFGEDSKHSICSVNYRTLDGCCEPPNSMYTHSKRVGCCRPPNFTQTFGTHTRCCTPEGAGQTRWNQTEDSPCGQFCSLPSSILDYSGFSSCCPSCHGERYHQTDSDVCGSCCSIYAEGYFISDGFCLYKEPPHDACTWDAALHGWNCASCLRNNVYLASGSCLFEGMPANDTCTLTSSMYSCTATVTVTYPPDPGPDGYYYCGIGYPGHVSDKNTYTTLIARNAVSLCSVTSYFSVSAQYDSDPICLRGTTGNCTGKGGCLSKTNPTYQCTQASPPHTCSALCADSNCNTFTNVYSCQTTYNFY